MEKGEVKQEETWMRRKVRKGEGMCDGSLKKRWRREWLSKEVILRTKVRREVKKSEMRGREEEEVEKGEVKQE
ncbi:MAG: hypothetical protein LBS37_08870, partial [Treponema sp.]|nr:hypothetical protein [Treponema sp.]